MKRLLIIIPISLLLGSLIALLIPTWQSFILAPGAVRQIDRWDEPVQLTIEDPAASNTFFIIKPARADQIHATSALAATPNLLLTNPEWEINPADVSWETSSGKTHTTHTAPGLSLQVRATVKVKDDAGTAGSGEVTLGGAGFEGLKKLGNVEIRKGVARWEGDHLLLARYRIVPDQAARFQALALESLTGGSPLSVAIAFILVCFLVYPKTKRQIRPEPLAPPVSFEESYSASLTMFALFGGICAFICLIIDIACLATTSPDMESTLGGMGVVAFVLAVVIAIIAPLTLWSVRFVEVTPNGIEIRRGRSGKVLFQAPWDQIKSVQPMVYRKRGKVTNEWLVIRNAAGKKIHVGKGYVQDYDLLRGIAEHMAARALGNSNESATIGG